MVLEHAALALLCVSCIVLWLRMDYACSSAERAQRRIDEWTNAMKGESARLAANVVDLDKDLEYIESWLESQGWEFRPEQTEPARWVKAKKS